MKNSIFLSVAIMVLAIFPATTLRAQNPVERAREAADALGEAAAGGNDPIEATDEVVIETLEQTDESSEVVFETSEQIESFDVPEPDTSVIDEVIMESAPVEPAPVADVIEAPIVESPVAETVAPPAEETPAVAIDTVEFGPAPSETNGSSTRITITLDDVSLEDTVRMFSQTSGANIIAAPNLFTGKVVSVNLVDVDWLPALRSILEIHNFTLVERSPGSGVFSVQPRGADAPEPTQIKTFFLDYTTAGEVHNSVEQMLRPGRKEEIKALKFDSRNALVVRSTESNIGELESLIKELDRPGKQILIEAKIIELSDEASKQLGIRWDSLEAFGVRAGLGPFTRTETSEDIRSTRDIRDASDRSYSVDSSRGFRDASGNIIPNNTTLSQNQSANSSVSVTPSGGNSSSGQSSLSSQNTTPVSIGNPNPGISQRTDGSTFLGTAGSSYTPGTESFDYRGIYNGSEQGALDTFTRTIVKEQSAILEMDTFQMVLSALEKTDGVSIVSNPKMIVTSGSTNAFFRVGSREPIIRQEIIRGTTDSPGDTIIAELDTEISTDFIRGGYLETGIDLGVIATAKTDDFIEAYIRPVLRRLLGQKTVEGNSWPIISVKEIGTSFTLRSGQTVAIGGLTDTEDTKETSKVPVLGSIPVLGRLFSHTKDVKRQFETIIFVTLSIADPDGLGENAGIPIDSRLVHNYLLRNEALAAQQEAKQSEEVAKPDESASPAKRKMRRR